MAHGAMSEAFAGFGDFLDLQNTPILTGLQHDGQVDAPSPWLSDGASRRRIFEPECPYYQGDAAQELPMLRFVEHFPEYVGSTSPTSDVHRADFTLEATSRTLATRTAIRPLSASMRISLAPATATVESSDRN